MKLEVTGFAIMETRCVDSTCGQCHQQVKASEGKALLRGMHGEALEVPLKTAREVSAMTAAMTSRKRVRVFVEIDE